MRKRSVVQVVLTQARYEFIKLARMRVYALLILLLPVLLYSMSASSQRMPEIDGLPGRIYLITTQGTFAAFGIALFGFGLGVAIERGQGWTHTLRPAPISPLLLLTAKLLVCMVFTLIAVILLLIVARVGFNVQLSPGTMLLLGVIMLAGSVPLCAAGLALGLLVGANSAPILAMIVYLFVSSVSGIVVPLTMVGRGFPQMVYAAPLWPTYHAAQLALAAVAPIPEGTFVLHCIALIAFAVGFFTIAAYAYTREMRQTYG